MRIDALTAGLGAETDSFTGTIHSVFARAGNIRLASGKLMGLVAREVGAVPRGFQLATQNGFSFLDHVRAGAPVACRAGLLRIDGSALSIDLRPAIPWRSQLDKFPIACDRPAVAEAWRAAWAALIAHGGAAPLQRQAGDVIEHLIAAAGASQLAKTDAAVSRLIGLGDGLTPAGDDFLVGFLAGLSALPLDRERKAFRAALAAAIAAAATRTGAISQLYLEAAIEGEVSEPLAALAAAIGQGNATEASYAAVNALAVGASSGAAASYGLLLAVRATEPVIPPVAGCLPSSAPTHDAIRRPGK